MSSEGDGAIGSVILSIVDLLVSGMLSLPYHKTSKRLQTSAVGKWSSPMIQMEFIRVFTECQLTVVQFLSMVKTWAWRLSVQEMIMTKLSSSTPKEISWKSTCMVLPWPTMVRTENEELWLLLHNYSHNICHVSLCYFPLCCGNQVLQQFLSWVWVEWRFSSVTNTLKQKVIQRCTQIFWLQYYCPLTTLRSPNLSTLPSCIRFSIIILYNAIHPTRNEHFIYWSICLGVSGLKWIWNSELCVLGRICNEVVSRRMLGYVLQWKLHRVHLLPSIYICPHHADWGGILVFKHVFISLN